VPSALPPGNYSFYLEVSLPTTDIPIQMTRITGPDLNIVPAGRFSFLSEAYEAFTVAAAPIRQWNLGTDGSWGNASNWMANVVPDAAGANASFANSATPITVTLDGDRTLGTLSLNSTSSFTIAPGMGGTLTLNNQGLEANVNAAGHHQIAVAVQAQDDATFTVGSDNDSLSLSQGITVTAGKTLTKAGAGVLSTAFMNGGSLHLQDGTLMISSSGKTASHVEGLSIDAGAVLDLTDNGLAVSNSTIDAITPMVQSGYAGGSWTGTGIISSLAAADVNHLTTVGLIQNNQTGLPIFTSQNLFHGYAPAPGDILLARTYYGDANLDGKVDGSDYSLIDSGFLSHATDWFNGDFNYDGTVNGSDYTLIDDAFNTQGTSLATSLANPNVEIASQFAGDTTAVPEPAIAFLLGIGVLGLKRRSSASAGRFRAHRG
jgi:hypothetical protein